MDTTRPATEAYTLDERELMQAFSSSPNGLSSSDAQAALLRHGPNAWSVEQKDTPLKILIRQLSNPLILLLVVAAFVSFSIGHRLDALGILSAIVLSVFFGFFQEYKAEQALSALKKMTAPRARVLRDGREREIPAEEVTVGDVLILWEGMLVPADARVMSGSQLTADQSLLTGESHPASKHSNPLPRSTSLAERSNLVYAGTQIVRGHGRALVFATGLSTEFGRIATSLAQTQSEPTPLQKQLGELGSKVGQASVGLAVLFFIVGLLRGQPWADMLVVAVSLAVAAIPEGLPTVLAMTMAIGVQRMASHHALVRKLPAVETLGSATVICTDKTGTLTANQMTLTHLYVDGVDYEFKGGPQALTADILRSDGKKQNHSDRARLDAALSAYCLCNDAALILHPSGSVETMRGDPTETALLIAAKKAGLDLDALRERQRLVADLPFEYSRKMMSQVRAHDGKTTAYVKGAPEVVLARATHLWKNGKAVKMTAADRKRLRALTAGYAHQALRTLAVAMREMPSSKGGRGAGASYSPTSVEQKLTWLGVCGMIDPPRPEAREALRLCQQAGIRVLMLTGDSLITAKVIASGLGLLPPGGQVLEAQELDQMSDAKLRTCVRTLSVLARATPEHKFRVISALQQNGEVVAVTGDGVNDAPSIKKANIGVAMGIGGTDVARGAADLVLTDNNFGTLVHAVSRGRSIYENIRSFVRFQFTTNVAALCLMFSAPLLGLPLPLAPLQILWINIIMDGPPAIALGLEPPHSDVMRRPPRPANSPFLTRPFTTAIVRTGLIIFILTLTVFGFYLSTEPAKATTMAFTVFIFLQLANALNCRSWRRPFWENLTGNKYLLLALLLALTLHLGILYWPPLQAAFGTIGLGPADWGILIAASALLLIQEEAFKRYRTAED